MKATQQQYFFGSRLLIQSSNLTPYDTLNLRGSFRNPCSPPFDNKLLEGRMGKIFEKKTNRFLDYTNIDCFRSTKWEEYSGPKEK